jgi:hypothetical protein
MTEKKCYKCGKGKNLEDFNNCKSSKDGKQSMCRECEKIRHIERTNNMSLEQYISYIFKNCKHNAKERCKTKNLAGEFLITKKYLLKLYNNQSGKCYYTGVKLNMNPKSDYQGSIERLNPLYGYTRENVAWVCLETNISAQFTIRKIKKILVLCNKSIDEDKLKDSIDTAKNYKPVRNTPQTKTEIIFVDENKFIKCNKCEEIKKISEFRKARSICKKCECIQTRIHTETLRGRIFSLIQHAKGATKIRKKVREMEACTLTFDELLNIYETQKGRCYYSNIPMKLKLNSSWRISLERTNVNLGYTKENCVLICNEFNGTDNSSKYTGQNNGNGGWTKKKFKFIYKHIVDKYLTD